MTNRSVVVYCTDDPSGTRRAADRKAEAAESTPSLRILNYDTVDSTNEVAKRLLQCGDIASPTLIIARAQTAGKGSRGRSWTSPRDAGIYMSLLRTRSSAPLRATARYTRAAGLACARLLYASFPLDVCVKPLNDLVIDGRKLGGILIETVCVGSTLEAMVVGLGLNVRRAPRPISTQGVPPVCLEDVLDSSTLDALDHQELSRALAEAIEHSCADVDQVCLGPEDAAPGAAFEKHRLIPEGI